MVQVTFIDAGGTAHVAEVEAGETLLKAAQALGLPLEGTCEGQMACSTCHVIVAEEWFPRLAPPSEEEEDMLDLAASVKRTSRLACQIIVDEALAGMRVHLPGEHRDMSRV